MATSGHCGSKNLRAPADDGNHGMQRYGVRRRNKTIESQTDANKKEYQLT